ncbi:MAG: c-type cytochrome biogenesis protein CcsB [Thermodesulfobacteriota bacterium]
MTEPTLIRLCIFVYMGSWLLYLLHAAFRKKAMGIAGDVAAVAGLLLQTLSMGVRWMESHRMGIGHAPLSNLYESMVFFSWTIALIFLIFARKFQNRLLGAFVMPLVFLSLASTSLMNPEIEPLVPALQSNWLTAHVITCFLGYAAFAVAFSLSLLYLLKSRGGEGAEGLLQARLPPADLLDDYSYRIIAVGFPMLTLGIITGAAWANEAWGTYWSWDPKETWSLIVWLIYAAYLHARLARGWQGRRAAWLSVIGFAATLFCYLGVNLFLSGLHSYGTG